MKVTDPQKEEEEEEDDEDVCLTCRCFSSESPSWGSMLKTPSTGDSSLVLDFSICGRTSWKALSPGVPGCFRF